MKYQIPYELKKDVKHPMNMPAKGYVTVEAENEAYAVCKAKKLIKVPHAILNLKIVAL